MKKLLTLAVALLLMTSLYAQVEVTYGPKFGWNISNITNSGDLVGSSGRNKMSFHFGGFAEVRMQEWLGLQTELIYSRQGFNYKSKHKMRVNYINIPVLAKFYVLDAFSVDMGPQFGFALNARHKIKEGGDVHLIKDKHFNVFDLSWAMGVTYEYESFLLSARYNLGMTNVWAKKHFEGNNNKNHVFQLSVGYRFGSVRI